MLGNNSNEFRYSDIYDATLYEILDKFVFEYQDEFALQRFLDRYHEALSKLRHIGKFDGRPFDIFLLQMGLRRMLIRKTKYMTVYSYKNSVVFLVGVYYNGLDFSQLKF